MAELSISLYVTINNLVVLLHTHLLIETSSSYYNVDFYLSLVNR